ncbi:hypothetical protein [Bacillus amyloliquefaciens]|uniref:hypothetical protein n=1 Tax=Bacillus amyloliquefaciens TaxID=1390 RepID=UPI00163992DA|nr:hypothetical protein [Bacillus amyloliquefaciens]
MKNEKAACIENDVFLQAFLFCPVSFSGAEKALPHAWPCLARYAAIFSIILNKISGSSEERPLFSL